MTVTANGMPVEFHHGDLVEASSGEERIRGRVEVYNGLAFVGKTGRSVVYYLEHGYEVRTVEPMEPVGGIA